MSELPMLDVERLDFSESGEFVNRTKRFFVPVPVLMNGGELMLDPASDMKPLREEPDARGIIIFSMAARAYQGIKGDGTEGLMFDNISEEEAWRIYKLMENPLFCDWLISDNPAEIELALSIIMEEIPFKELHRENTVDVPKEHEQLFLPEHLKRVAEQVGMFGYIRCTKPTRHRAIWLRFPFAMTSGPVPQYYPFGAVVVTSGRYRWGIETGVFAESFHKVVGEAEFPLGDLTKVEGLPIIDTFPE